MVFNFKALHVAKGFKAFGTFTVLAAAIAGLAACGSGSQTTDAGADIVPIVPMLARSLARS